MRPYLNKIFMMRSDIQYLNLTGPEGTEKNQKKGPLKGGRANERLAGEPCSISNSSLFTLAAQPTRQNVFWVHGFSPQTRTSDIIRHFQPLGTIDIKWIDDTSLLATVQNPNIVAQVNLQLPLHIAFAFFLPFQNKVIPYFATVRPPFIVADFETYMASAVRYVFLSYLPLKDADGGLLTEPFIFFLLSEYKGKRLKGDPSLPLRQGEV